MTGKQLFKSVDDIKKEIEIQLKKAEQRLGEYEKTKKESLVFRMDGRIDAYTELLKMF
jgi:hypothetical protein